MSYLASRRALVAHFLDEELVHNLLTAAEHPAGHGIKVADDALAQFIGEFVGLKLQLLRVPYSQVSRSSLMPGALRLFFRKVFETIGQARGHRDLAARVGDRRVAAGLLEAEAQEGAVGVARRGADPPASGLPRPASRNCASWALLRGFAELDQFILQFERAELEERLLVVRAVWKAFLVMDRALVEVSA